VSRHCSLDLNVIAGLTRNPATPIKAGCRIKPGMTDLPVIAGLTRNPATKPAQPIRKRVAQG